jgi:hypothetical protein
MPWRRGNINGLSILWQLGLDETLCKIDAYGLATTNKPSTSAYHLDDQGRERKCENLHERLGRSTLTRRRLTRTSRYDDDHPFMMIIIIPRETATPFDKGVGPCSHGWADKYYTMISGFY